MKLLSTSPETPSCILSQYLWFNQYIRIDNSPVNFKGFSQRNINFISQLIDTNGNFKTWERIKNEYNLDDQLYFQWLQIINAIPRKWKELLRKNTSSNVNNLFLQNHHIIKNFRTLTLEKLSSKELYSTLISKNKSTPTSQIYFTKLFQNEKLNWEKNYTLTCIITSNSYQRNFQYKILHNILYFNNKLFIFGKVCSSLCSFCHLVEESLAHLFCECKHVISLWQQLGLIFKEDLKLPHLTLQTATFGILTETETVTFKLINHLLLIFKQFVYTSRETGVLRLDKLINQIKKIKKI